MMVVMVMGILMLRLLMRLSRRRRVRRKGKGGILLDLAASSCFPAAQPGFVILLSMYVRLNPLFEF